MKLLRGGAFYDEFYLVYEVNKGTQLEFWVLTDEEGNDYINIVYLVEENATDHEDVTDEFTYYLSNELKQDLAQLKQDLKGGAV